MPALSKEFLDIQATIDYGFTLKYVRDMIRTYSQVALLFWLNVRFFMLGFMKKLFHM